MNFFYNNIIIIPAITFFITVIVKWLLIKIKKWNFDLNSSLWSGGMPSVHTSVVVSMTVAVALKNGIWSDLFAIALTVTLIIIYDAINIRYEAWLHAKQINKYIWKKKLKESLWHLPSEAFAWSIIWILVAIILFYV